MSTTNFHVKILCLYFKWIIYCLTREFRVALSNFFCTNYLAITFKQGFVHLVRCPNLFHRHTVFWGRNFIFGGWFFLIYLLVLVHLQLGFEMLIGTNFLLIANKYISSDVPWCWDYKLFLKLLESKLGLYFSTGTFVFLNNKYQYIWNREILLLQLYLEVNLFQLRLISAKLPLKKTIFRKVYIAVLTS